MTFISDIATTLAIILVACGVNLTDMTNGNVSVPAAIATEAPATTESATAEPTGEPSADPAQPETSPDALAAQDVAIADFVTENDVVGDVQSLATQMYAGIISGVKYQAPTVVEDNADTHLSTRWVDYVAAKTARDDSTKLIAFLRPGVVPEFKSMYADGEYIVAQADCTITLKTASGANQEAKLGFMLKYADSAAGRSIVALSISGDADYDTLKAMLPSDADMSAMDASVDAAISALG